MTKPHIMRYVKDQLRMISLPQTEDESIAETVKTSTYLEKADVELNELESLKNQPRVDTLDFDTHDYMVGGTGNRLNAQSDGTYQDVKTGLRFKSLEEAKEQLRMISKALNETKYEKEYCQLCGDAVDSFDFAAKVDHMINKHNPKDNNHARQMAEYDFSTTETWGEENAKGYAVDGYVMELDKFSTIADEPMLDSVQASIYEKLKRNLGSMIEIDDEGGLYKKETHNPETENIKPIEIDNLGKRKLDI